MGNGIFQIVTIGEMNQSPPLLSSVKEVIRARVDVNTHCMLDQVTVIGVFGDRCGSSVVTNIIQGLLVNCLEV